MMDVDALKKLINEAEQVWFTVCYADRKGPEIYINGYAFQVIDDKRFGTPRDVYRYFHRYWSDSLTKTMMCNLKVIDINGEAATVLGDPPALPSVVERLRIKESGPGLIKVSAVLSGEIDRNRTIEYTLKKQEDGKFRIVGRTGKREDSRYQPCTCLLA